MRGICPAGRSVRGGLPAGRRHSGQSQLNKSRSSSRAPTAALNRFGCPQRLPCRRVPPVSLDAPFGPSSQCIVEHPTQAPAALSYIYIRASRISRREDRAICRHGRKFVMPVMRRSFFPVSDALPSTSSRRFASPSSAASPCPPAGAGAVLPAFPRVLATAGDVRPCGLPEPPAARWPVALRV